MKRNLLISATLALVALTSSPIYAAETETSPATQPNASNLYALTAVVTETNTASDTVTVETPSGNLFEFYGVEDYFEGDFVSMIMWDKGTETVIDDEILDVRYAGFSL